MFPAACSGKDIVIANKLLFQIRPAHTVATMLLLLSACAAPNKQSITTTNDSFVPIQGSSDTEFQAVQAAPSDPSQFSAELIGSMGSTIAECGPDAQANPHVTWTCAQFNQGLDSFIKSLDTVTNSVFFSSIHKYKPLSDWMYFEIDGEIDFFWKTFELESTQALVTYDPSETGNELIIGLHKKIADQIALAKGSHKLTDETRLLPIQQ